MSPSVCYTSMVEHGQSDPAAFLAMTSTDYAFFPGDAIQTPRPPAVKAFRGRRNLASPLSDVATTAILLQAGPTVNATSDTITSLTRPRVA